MEPSCLQFQIEEDTQGIVHPQILLPETEMASVTAVVSAPSKMGLSIAQRSRAQRDRWLVFVNTKGETIPEFVILAGLLFLVYRPFTHGESTGQMFLAAGFGIVAALALIGGIMVPMSRRIRAASRQAKPTDVNILLYAIDHHASWVGFNPMPNDLTNATVREALLKALPTLRDTDADLVSTQSHRILNKCLQSNDKEVALAVLEALPRIGTQSAISHVEALAKRQGKLKSYTSVQQAAAVCLGLLKERLAHQNSKTLLRASQPEQYSVELLRPAESIAETTPEELLRALHANEVSPGEKIS